MRIAIADRAHDSRMKSPLYYRGFYNGPKGTKILAGWINKEFALQICPSYQHCLGDLPAGVSFSIHTLKEGEYQQTTFYRASLFQQQQQQEKPRSSRKRSKLLGRQK